MRGARAFFIVLGAVVLSVALLAVANIGSAVVSSDRQQGALTPFYTPPEPLPGGPGTVIRTEPMDAAVAGGTAYRVLYVSARPDGTPAASGAMVFIPDSPAPPDGRPVVAWAHGTVGMGDACAPSRSPTGLSDLEGWLQQMMSLGWVVVATDYVGLGTPGPELYLVGQAEANDVVYSVQAVRSMADAHAGDSYAVFGHSQGGHSALWTGALSASIAPELKLVGVAAAAPAAELSDIVGAQWNTAIGWAIGAEVAISWPYVDPSLPFDGVLTKAAMNNFERVAHSCIDLGAVESLARDFLGQNFFATNPLDSPPWAKVVRDQTPRPLPATIPLVVSQGTADEVVLPWPNGVLQDDWCAAGSDITMQWLGGVNHMKAAIVSGPLIVPWIADRFAGRPASRTCDTPPPVDTPTPVPSLSVQQP